MTSKKTSFELPVSTEAVEQAHFFLWLKTLHPALWEGTFAIPNGGSRGGGSSKSAMLEGLHLKRQGVKAGVPDVFLAPLKLFLEFKRTKGSTTSPEQKEWHERLRGYGFTVEIAKGCDAAILIVEKELGAQNRQKCATEL